MKMPPLELIQRRIAHISIGPSTVRGQPTGTARTIREYLESLDLGDFSAAANQADFISLLDRHTSALTAKLDSGRWGIARKGLNIFLFQATHDILLNKNYSLDTIIPYLELPLDNPNAKRLVKLAKSDGVKLEWTNISSLKPEMSLKFQSFARQYADNKYGCHRCYLDVYWWRSDD